MAIKEISTWISSWKVVQRWTS